MAWIRRFDLASLISCHLARTIILEIGNTVFVSEKTKNYKNLVKWNKKLKSRKIVRNRFEACQWTHSKNYYGNFFPTKLLPTFFPGQRLYRKKEATFSINFFWTKSHDCSKKAGAFYQQTILQFHCERMTTMQVFGGKIQALISDVKCKDGFLTTFFHKK